MNNDIIFFIPIFFKNKNFFLKNNNIRMFIKYKKKNLNIFNDLFIENIFYNKFNNYLHVKKKNFE